MTGPERKRIYRWDRYSDQPHVIQDKRAKRRLYWRGAEGSLKTLLTAIVALPLAWAIGLQRRSVALPALASAIGLAVNVESELAETTRVSMETLQACVDELGVDHLLLRVPLGDAEHLAPYRALVERFAGKRLLIDVLQDRDHIEDQTLFEAHLRCLFTTFCDLTEQFKIGNAVNRRKWAFFSLDEYFAFFGTAQRLRDREFPRLELLGGAIIDFELPNFARSVLHFHPIRYDAVAALLYVDRRGAPENHQLGVNLIGKIRWFTSLMRMSRKCADKLVITETNWPLRSTEPFAPAVGDCMVDEDRQAAYLARYYLLAFASGQVDAVYWHQLVAPGYGLIDNRGVEVRYRRAFYALRTLTGLFSQASVLGFEQSEDRYVLRAERDRQRLTAVWTNDTTATVDVARLIGGDSLSQPASVCAYSLTGDRLEVSDTLAVSGEVTYIVESTAG